MAWATLSTGASNTCSTSKNMQGRVARGHVRRKERSGRGRERCTSRQDTALRRGNFAVKSRRLAARRAELARARRDAHARAVTRAPAPNGVLAHALRVDVVVA